MGNKNGPVYRARYESYTFSCLVVVEYVYFKLMNELVVKAAYKKTIRSTAIKDSFLNFKRGLHNTRLRSDRHFLDTITGNNGNNFQHPRYPIVLCHGLFGFDKIQFGPFNFLRSIEWLTRPPTRRNGGSIVIDYWGTIKRALENNGCKVLTAKVPPLGDIENRAKALNEYLTRNCKEFRTKENYRSKNHDNMGNTEDMLSKSSNKLKVNLVAHSMGGLDCRYLISKLDHESYEVASLCTISTPHRGSVLADFVFDLTKKYPFLSKACPLSIKQLTTQNMAQFNKEVRDDPNVAYFSFGAKFLPKWYNVFFIPWKIAKQKTLSLNTAYKDIHTEDNDGLVSVESAKWGTYLGTLNLVDHLDLINWTNKLEILISKVTDRLNLNYFDATVLYLYVAKILAEENC